MWEDDYTATTLIISSKHLTAGLKECQVVRLLIL